MTLTPPRDRTYYQRLRARLTRDPDYNREAGTDLDTLIEQHQAPYREPRARAWIEKKLRSWWGARDGQ